MGLVTLRQCTSRTLAVAACGPLNLAFICVGVGVVLYVGGWLSF